MNVSAMSNHRGQVGFGLVELMVSMAIGLFMLLAVAQIFLSGTGASRVDDNAARLQESGRIAIELIGREMRKAGYLDDASKLRKDVFLAGNGFTLISSTTATADTLSVRYVASQDSYNQNCLGATVPAGTLVRQTFALTSGALSCTVVEGSGTAQTAALAPDVEAIRVRAAVDTTGDREPDSYVTPSTVTNWENVMGFDIQIRVVSPEDNVTAKPQKYLDFDNSTLITPTDRRLRRTYGTFVALRNAFIK